MRNNTVVLYHANCNDGFGAAFAHWFCNVWDKKGDPLVEEPIYVPMNYGDKIPYCVNEESTVYFLDYSMPKDIIEELASNVKKIVVIDHHKTSLELLDISLENVVVTHSMEHSGAMLTWLAFGKDFSTTTTPLLFKLIEDRDLWKFKLEDTKAFHIGMASFPRDFEAWLDLIHTNEIYEVIAKGQHMLEYQGTILNSLMPLTTVDTIEGNTCMFVQCPPMLSSDMADVIFENYSTLPICAMYSIQDNKVVYSLRNNNKRIKESWIDVSEIAKKYNGGGHASAAGFKVDINDSHLLKGL